MSITVPCTADAVNPQPGYYAVIPVKVLRCKDLPPSAKLLYGDISALCSVEGYSWASNAYFAALYDVDERTVQRWLSALVKEGFISVSVIGPNRRIYLAEAVQKRQKRATKTPPLGRQKCQGKGGKNVTHSITLNKTINSTSEDARGAPRFVGPGPVAARDLARVEQEEKGSASPPTLIANPKKLRQVERAVARCGSLSLRGQFSDLWDVVEQEGREGLWQEALDAVKLARNASTGIVEPPATYFCGFVRSALASAV